MFNYWFNFNWFNFGDYGLDVYSNGVMVSQKLLKENPEAVAGLVRAINRAMKEVIANPGEGVAVMLETEPLLNAEIEKLRVEYAMENLMLTPETEALSLGDLDDERLERAIGVIVNAYELTSTPSPTDIFNRDFLPEKTDRILAAAQ